MGRYFVGAISGTSTDGLDIALIETEASPIRTLNARTIDFPQELRKSLLALSKPGENEIYRKSHTDAQLGIFIGNSINDFVEDAGLKNSEIEAIGSHGQTIRHHPEATPSFTVQIGSGAHIAEICRIPTINDFRSRDMAAGGEGAPLIPSFHDAIFRSEVNNRVILNLGGIANISILDLDNNNDTLVGFDTGPANTLLDSWIESCQEKPFDHKGGWAKSGNLNGRLLTHLLKDPYFRSNPPKSTGKEHFNLLLVKSLIKKLSLTLEEVDVQTTLSELTAITIAQAITRWGPASGEIIVCGGGRHNEYVLSRIKHHTPNYELFLADDLGIDGDAVEACAFGWLAKCFMDDIQANPHHATVAAGPRVLGCLYPA